MEESGGELSLAELYYIKSASEKDLLQAESYFIEQYPEKELLKAALVHLLPGIDSAKQESFLSMLEARGVATNMYDVPGWDAHILNAQMLEILSADCAHTAELIEKEGFYRWSEQHKQTLMNILAARNHKSGNLEIRVPVLGNRLFCA